MSNWKHCIKRCPWSLLLLLQSALVAAQSCQKYEVQTAQGKAVFNNYAFYDWRNMNDDISGTPVYTQNMDFDNPQFGLATSSFFNSTPWTDNWSTSATKKMNNLTMSQYYPMVYTPLNVAIIPDPLKKDSTVLSLSSIKLNDYAATAEINTNDKFFHASVRMSARVIGPPGACGAFFLYGDDQNESDIEVLTNDTAPVFHATNHPSQDAKGNPIKGATSDGALIKNGTTKAGQSNSTLADYNEYRIDWTPDRTTWLINGAVAVTKTMNIPKIPSWLGLNMWSNGGTWTGNMTVNETAQLQVRWIEVIYNTTNDKPSSGGSSCSVKSNNDGYNHLGNVNAAVSLSSGVSQLFLLVSGLWILFFLGS